MSSTFRRHRKRTLRYGLLASNVLLLVVVTSFIIRTPSSDSNIRQNALATESTSSSNPLDQLSSADIAVHISRMTNLTEAPSVTNNADSVSQQLIAPTNDTMIIAKPQIVSTNLKSKKDIQKYTAVAGDTISSIASKFGVTSDSIRWSNSITGDNVAVNKALTIPPVNGLTYTVKSGDTAETLATKYRTGADLITAFNDAEVTGLKVGDLIVIPDGSIAAPVVAPSYYSGFAFGSSAIYGYNGYDPGWCTWYSANRRAELGRPVPANLGNAYSWYVIALRSGLPTGATPAVGAVAVNQAGNHVSVVEVVNADGSFWISEMNASGQRSLTDTTRVGGWNVRDYRLVPSAGSLKFIY